MLVWRICAELQALRKQLNDKDAELQGAAKKQHELEERLKQSEEELTSVKSTPAKKDKGCVIS
jgi:hypothetical protein